jgi:hypothetical protein
MLAGLVTACADSLCVCMLQSSNLPMFASAAWLSSEHTEHVLPAQIPSRSRSSLLCARLLQRACSRM